MYRSTLAKNAALVFVSLTVVTGQKSSPFLKEILLGRCYNRPPNDNFEDSVLCPEIVESFMGVLEHNLDDDIDTDSFSAYFDKASFVPPNEKGAIFWLTEESPQSWTLSTPENTSGGMTKGFNFCGMDLREDCPANSRARSSFWIRGYGEYSKLAEGNVHIVVSENDEEEIYQTYFLEGAIPNLDASLISSVTIYSKNCDSNHPAKVIATAFEELLGLDSECTNDFAPLLLCKSSTCHSMGLASGDTHVPTSSPSLDDDAIHQQNRTHSFILLCVSSFCIMGAFWTSRRIFNDYENVVGNESIPLQPKQ